MVADVEICHITVNLSDDTGAFITERIGMMTVCENSNVLVVVDVSKPDFDFDLVCS